MLSRLTTILGVSLASLSYATTVWAAEPQTVTLSTEPSPSMIPLVVIFGLMSLLPALVLTTTCFTRFVIVFSFLKTGLGTQGAPPNQVLVGLALFMTAFVMAPVATEMYEKAGNPYMQGALDEAGAYAAAEPIAREWLMPRTRPEDLALFYDYTSDPRPHTADDVPLRIAVPAYILSELRTAFQMGLLVLLPFLVIDLVAATVLSSLGMVMLPPTLVSLPIKLLVFVMADGWNVLVMSLLRGVAT